MKILENLQYRLDLVCKIIATVGFVFLIFISFLTMYDAVMRWLLLPSIPGFGDWGLISFPIIICATFPAVLLHRKNVSIEFLGAALGPVSKKFLELFASIITLIFFYFLSSQFVLLGIDLQANNRTTGVEKIPVAFWWWIATVIILFCLPVQVWMIFNNIKSAFFEKINFDKNDPLTKKENN